MATNRIPENHWLRTKPIAHRGYWGGDVPENSRAAYERAAEKGYPIEIDVYLTKDEKIVSFHDGTLKRMTGGEGGVWDYTYEELQQFRLGNSQETIPLLSEVLAIAEGRSPLLIEIKEQKNENIVAKLLEALEGYAGEYAVQSFMPQYIHEVKRRTRRDPRHSRFGQRREQPVQKLYHAQYVAEFLDQAGLRQLRLYRLSASQAKGKKQGETGVDGDVQRNLAENFPLCRQYHL